MKILEIETTTIKTDQQINYSQSLYRNNSQ